MEASNTFKPGSDGGCSAKSAVKFCLIYFSTLLVLTLIFAAINNEPMNKRQVAWWWAFLGSLLISGTISLGSLILLIYTDYKSNAATAAGAGYSELDIERQNIPVMKSPTPPAPENSQSASFKTILTINSTQEPGVVANTNPAPTTQGAPNPVASTQAAAVAAGAGGGAQLSASIQQQAPSELPGGSNLKTRDRFVNLTPQARSPVTVIDLHSMNAAKRRGLRVEERANLGAIRSRVLAGSEEAIKVVNKTLDKTANKTLDKTTLKQKKRTDAKQKAKQREQQTKTTTDNNKQANKAKK